MATLDAASLGAIFKAYDIRGTVPDQLDAHIVERVGAAFARFVADSYGPPKLRELYLATCGLRRADLATAAQEVLGTSPAGLLTRWHQWLTH